MKILFLADAMLPRKEAHNLSALNALQYSTLPELRIALASIPHAVLLGPVILATLAREAGHEVEILECAFRPQQRELLRAKLKEKPQVVCISTTFILETEALAEQTQLVRALTPESFLILGGPSVADNKKMRKLGDFTILGEGEKSFPLLLASLARGEKKPVIPGLSYFEGEELIEHPGQLLEDMDAIPFPDWSLVKRGTGDFYLMATQRGCKWRCAFCTYPANEGWKLRYRSIPSVIAELTHHFEKFGIFRYMFADSTFTHPHDRCVELLEAISRLPFKIEWAAYARVDNMSARMVEAMKASGCVGLFFGVESGSDAILKKMNKGFTRAQALEGLRLLDGSGISRTASWVVGFPGETEETALETLALIREARCEQNMINTFYMSNVSPAGMRPKTFTLEGSGSHWQHSTMNFEEARDLTSRMVKELIREGILVGHVFDLLWLSSVDWSIPETLRLFEDAQAVLQAHELGEPSPRRPALLASCEKLMAISRRHPIFSEANL